jgi:hypothetical protein
MGSDIVRLSQILSQHDERRETAIAIVSIIINVGAIFLAIYALL